MQGNGKVSQCSSLSSIHRYSCLNPINSTLLKTPRPVPSFAVLCQPLVSPRTDLVELHFLFHIVFLKPRPQHGTHQISDRKELGRCANIRRQEMHKRRTRNLSFHKHFTFLTVPNNFPSFKHGMKIIRITNQNANVDSEYLERSSGMCATDHHPG